MQDATYDADDAREGAGVEGVFGAKMDELPLSVSQRVHAVADPRKVGTIRYVGPVEGYDGSWIGVDWDDGGGKHDGVVNGVRYFSAKGTTAASFVRSRSLSAGITLMDALRLRYQGDSSNDTEEEMYVLSASNRRVSIQLLGKNSVLEKLSKLERLLVASLSYMGISSVGPSCEISSAALNLKELDLTGNLLSSWKEVSSICKSIPSLKTLNLTKNLLEHDATSFTPSESLRVLVLNKCGITWEQIEILKGSLSEIEELHLMSNKLKITSSSCIQGFDSLRVLNLEDNSIDTWHDVLKLSQLKRLEQLHLNGNELEHVFYPDEADEYNLAFSNLRCLLLGCNRIDDVASIDSLNSFPNLVDVRISGNPVTDPTTGGLPRFVIIARLSKIQMLNGSQVSPRERKEAEIRYVRMIIAKEQLSDPDEISRTHPRFKELQLRHGIEDEKSSNRIAGTQRMASELICLTLKCVGPSMGEKPPSMKKLPPSTTIGKLKALCESFFKLRSIKLRLFFEEQGCPFPLLLDDDSATMVDFGIVSGSTILVDEQL